MNKETHINVFDFDDTLFRVPDFTCISAKGIHPYVWFADPKSLSMDLHNIVGIENTLDRARDPNSLNYLITHRFETCSAEVLLLLAEHNTRFNDIFFLNIHDVKAKKVVEILKSNPQTKTLTIYEDSLWQVIEYASFFQENETDITIDFVFVDKRKVIMIDWISAKSLANLSRNERLRLHNYDTIH